MVRTLASTAYLPSVSDQTPNSLLKAVIPSRLPGRENSTPTMIAFDCDAARVCQTDGGENQGYYNKEGGTGEGFSGRNRGDNDNEYGRENQGNEYGSRNRDDNEYGGEKRYVFAWLSIKLWCLVANFGRSPSFDSRGEGRGEGYGGDRSNDY